MQMLRREALKLMLKEMTKNRWKFAIIPAVIIIAGIVMLFVHGFNFDVEFMGGTSLEVDLKTSFNNDDITKIIQDATPDKNVSATVQKGDKDNIAIIKIPPLSNDTNEETTMLNNILTELDKKYGAMAPAENAEATAAPAEATTAPAEATAAPEATEGSENVVKPISNSELKIDVLSRNNASASFGEKVQLKTLVVVLIAILCILIYIIIRFNWMQAVMAVVALAINVLIMAAVYTITYIPLNTTFIAAMLTVIGYSINNTIVIFDRIRENQKSRKKDESIFAMTDRSILETMGRTINSTITTLITIVLIFILGVSTIKQFALPLIVGIIAGAYTSIFIASTFWAAWKESDVQAKALAAQERKTNKSKKK